MDLCACGHLESLHDHAGLCWRQSDCDCRGFDPHSPIGQITPGVFRATNPSALKRWRMWKKNPRCYYCGIRTRFVHRGGQSNARVRDDEATIEHLYSRLHPWRLEHRKEGPTVIACHKCNAERNNIEQRARAGNVKCC